MTRIESKGCAKMSKELIKTNDVNQVATLSRLEFDEKETEKLKQDLSEIVSYFGGLLEVDTKGVPAVVKPEGVLREDCVGEGLTSSQVVQNAPKHTHNAFVVPKVVE